MEGQEASSQNVQNSMNNINENNNIYGNEAQNVELNNSHNNNDITFNNNNNYSQNENAEEHEKYEDQHANEELIENNEEYEEVIEYEENVNQGEEQAQVEQNQEENNDNINNFNNSKVQNEDQPEEHENEKEDFDDLNDDDEDDEVNENAILSANYVEENGKINNKSRAQMMNSTNEEHNEENQVRAQYNQNDENKENKHDDFDDNLDDNNLANNSSNNVINNTKENNNKNNIDDNSTNGFYFDFGDESKDDGKQSNNNNLKKTSQQDDNKEANYDDIAKKVNNIFEQQPLVETRVINAINVNNNNIVNNIDTNSNVINMIQSNIFEEEKKESKNSIKQDSKNNKDKEIEQNIIHQNLNNVSEEIPEEIEAEPDDEPNITTIYRDVIGDIIANIIGNYFDKNDEFFANVKESFQNMDITKLEEPMKYDKLYELEKTRKKILEEYNQKQSVANTIEVKKDRDEARQKAEQERDKALQKLQQELTKRRNYGMFFRALKQLQKTLDKISKDSDREVQIRQTFNALEMFYKNLSFVKRQEGNKPRDKIIFEAQQITKDNKLALKITMSLAQERATQAHNFHENKHQPQFEITITEDLALEILNNGEEQEEKNLLNNKLFLLVEQQRNRLLEDEEKERLFKKKAEKISREYALRRLRTNAQKERKKTTSKQNALEFLRKKRLKKGFKFLKANFELQKKEKELRKEKLFQIIPTTTVNILATKKPANQIDYMDDFRIDSIEKPKLEEQGINGIALIGFERPDNMVEAIDGININSIEKPKLELQPVISDIALSGLEKPENIVESIDEIHINSIEKPELEWEEVDDIQLIEEKRQSWTDSDILPEEANKIEITGGKKRVKTKIQQQSKRNVYYPANKNTTMSKYLIQKHQFYQNNTQNKNFNLKKSDLKYEKDNYKDYNSYGISNDSKNFIEETSFDKNEKNNILIKRNVNLRQNFDRFNKYKQINTSPEDSFSSVEPKKSNAKNNNLVFKKYNNLKPSSNQNNMVKFSKKLPLYNITKKGYNNAFSLNDNNINDYNKTNLNGKETSAKEVSSYTMRINLDQEKESNYINKKNAFNINDQMFGNVFKTPYPNFDQLSNQNNIAKLSNEFSFDNMLPKSQEYNCPSRTMMINLNQEKESNYIKNKNDKNAFENDQMFRNAFKTPYPNFDQLSNQNNIAKLSNEPYFDNMSSKSQATKNNCPSHTIMIAEEENTTPYNFGNNIYNNIYNNQSNINMEIPKIQNEQKKYFKNLNNFGNK